MTFHICRINSYSTIGHVKKFCFSLQIQNPLLCYFPFSIEISLRTAEGDAMVLEHWVLSLKDPPDPICR